ncbi:TolC family outer membrane protein [Phenylobacterium sp.]|jgi:outer membrane protein/S-layer protein transport system outer membrane protein|uniref:TolC family outer membrane protein n=1 Tax=Phenylobacterium sp. TaxID=1871053 RepID=UPI002F930026
MSRPRLPTLLATAAVAAIVCASCARAETLEEAIAYVYQTDAGLQGQRAAVRATDELSVQARNALGPQASVGYTFGRQEIDRGPTTAHAFNPSWSATITQPLYTGGRQSARIEQATSQILVARQNLRRFEAELLQRVINAYTAVRRDQEVVRISADAVKVLAQQLSDTLAKSEERVVTATDVAQARARLASARTQLAFAEGQLAVSRAQYVSTIGKAPGELAPEPALPEPPREVTAAFRMAEENNPNLLVAEFNERASRARVAEARAGRRPNVALRVEGARQPTLPYARAGEVESLTTSLAVTQPIFTSGVTSSQIRQAVEENNRDRLNIEATRKLVISAVAEAWESLAASRTALITQDEEVRDHQVAFIGVREEERLALRGTLDVLNAEAELRAAQLDLVRSRAAEYQRRAQLLAALGMLSTETLAPQVERYDPADNLRSVSGSPLGPLTGAVATLDRVGAPPLGARRPATIENLTPPSISALPAAPDTRTAVKIELTSELVARANRGRRARVQEREAAEPARRPSR